MPTPDELRRRVLAAWTDSPARFREDANAEEDLVRGGYRDRLLVELAQNASDAARRAGVPGRLRLTLADGVLTAANTGAPLDDDGVAGLASLRASAKRDDAGSVGRFGVGFAAVLAVCDEPTVLSSDRSVRFSAADTRSAVSAVLDLAAERARREGGVPVLRLPFDVDGAPPGGFDTAVVLPLRPGAVADVRAALDALAPDLLLALPGLAAIEVGDRVLTALRSPDRVVLAVGGASTTWAVATRSGELPADLDRAVEERGRTAFTVTWAVPLDDDGAPVPTSGPVHAPTASDEPLSVPARLVAPFPLGPDRRHVLPGPVTDLLVAAAADAFVDLVTDLAGSPRVLALVPRIRLAGAELDAAVCAAVLQRLRDTAWLPAADPEEPALRPDRAAVLDEPDDARVTALAGVLPGLIPAEWSRDRQALAALGVRRVGLAEVVEAVRGVTRAPSWWADLYAALARADRDELAVLPVPLADGRTAQSPAGVLLPTDLPSGLAALGLRVAHPAAVTGAAAGVLERLGARAASPAALLEDADVRAAVATSLDRADAGDPDEEVAELARAVLALVGAAGTRPGEHPWLAELALPDDDGGWAPAGELVLPGSAFAAVLEPGALGLLDPAFEADRDALRAVGVLDGFALVTADDPDDLDVDGAGEWADVVLDRLPPGPPPTWPSLTAVRDLDVVADWPAALPLLAALPAVARGDVDLGGAAVPGYLRWWLRTHPVLAGRRPDRLRHPASTELAGLYDAVDAPPEVLELLAPPATVADVLADVDDALDLLDRLADPHRTVPPGVLPTVHARLAAALDGVNVDPPAAVRVAPERVAPDAVVLDAPWLLPLLDRPVVPAGGAPGAVADLLDLPLASEVVATRPVLPGMRTRWADLPGAALAAARLGLAVLPGEVAVGELRAGDRAGSGGRAGDVVLTWWPGTGGGPDAADGSPAALGRALAWRHQAWGSRAALAEAFAAGEDDELLAAEDSLGS